ncbi:MAG: hypothetical protein QM726_24695 [Chitinophagaceae bacterium]
MKNPLLLLILFMLTIAMFSNCSKEYSASGFTKIVPKEDSFNLTLNFTPIVDSMKLSFDSTYRNFWKEEYKISAFKFYVSNFNLINTDSGRTYHVDTAKYFLIDAADSTTWTVKLLAKPFIYNRLSLMIGIDSAHVVNNDKKGAFDPANGMYWDATSGYIMARLEGSSSVSSNGAISYSIGGYTGDNSVLQKPTLLFPFGQYLKIDTIPNSKSIINITADVNDWFYNPFQVKIATTPSCTTPGLTAKSISENYSKMFTVTAVINN